MDLNAAIYINQQSDYIEDVGKVAELKSKVSADRDLYHREKRDQLLLVLEDSQKFFRAGIREGG